MRRYTRALVALLLLSAAAVGYAAGRLAAPPETTLRRNGEWVEVRYRGELVAEYHAADGAPYEALADALTLRP